jgi:methylmalonyl-CoA mutase N-terminal domain/subunit
MREAGATAIEEVGFTLANGLEYVRLALDAGLELERFAPRLSFFFASHNDLFEEAAKFRAARRLWARLLRERHQASDTSCRLRFHTQTGGVTLQAQQPLNNVVRVTVQALAAVLGGTQSLHTNGYDEALSLPTEASATLALRTQQILGYESGTARTVDPLAGSYYVEHLTDEIEAGAKRLIDEVDTLGGSAAAIEAGYFQKAIGESAWRQQQAQEQGEQVVVGVNRFTDDSPAPVVAMPDFSDLARQQIARLEAARAARDGAQVRTALDRVAEMARREDGRLMPGILDAVRGRATLGEISDVLRREWGEYRAAR